MDVAEDIEPVRTSTSLQPSSPPKSSGVNCMACTDVPIAPSTITTRRATASRKELMLRRSS
ncbi:MAG: hypothetical protein ACRDZ4_12105 [Egibacteraceae bacterium]